MSGTVLLTGATGFVGRQILRALQERGHPVRAVVRSDSAGRLGDSTGVEVVETPDVFAESSAWWTNICERVDTVIHAAWYAKPGLYLQAPENLACLKGTLALAHGCAEAGVRRFAGIGTCFEYDLSGGVLDIDTPLRPTTAYAGAKAAAFLALSNWFPATQVEFVWCRLFYLYGVGESEGRLVPYLRHQLMTGQIAELTSGTQIRDYLDVCEAGRLITRTSLGTQQGAVNICSGTSQTVRQLAERIADEYGRRDLLKFGARPDNLVDPPRVLGVRQELR